MPLRFTALLTLLALLVQGCSSDDDQRSRQQASPTASSTIVAPITPTAESTATTEPTPLATATSEVLQAPELPGPYDVGATTLQLERTSSTTGEPRVLEVVLWYPAGATNGLDPELQATRNAPLSPDAPFPLIVFSHGSGGNPLQSVFLTTHLASHGFVVAALSHPGNTTEDCFPCSDQSALQDSYFNRPDDVAFVRDQLVSQFREGGTGEGPAAESIDPAQIGITGHSFGGFTTIAALSQGGFAAGAALAPVDIVLVSGTHADINQPVLVFGAARDTTTPFAQQIAIYDRVVNAEERTLVRLERGGHLSFSDYCLSFSPGCGPNDLPPDEAQQIIDRYVTAFFRLHLLGEEQYREFLEPGSEPGTEVTVVNRSSANP